MSARRRRRKRAIGREKAKGKSGFRSAERCLGSLSRQVLATRIKFPEEDMIFIGKPDRLLEGGKNEAAGHRLFIMAATHGHIALVAADLNLGAFVRGVAVGAHP